MQTVLAFAEALERFSRSKALREQSDLASPSQSLIAAVRGLIVEGAFLTVECASLTELVASIKVALGALRDLAQPTGVRPGVAPLLRSSVEWMVHFRVIAQQIRACVEAAEAAQRVGDPEAARALTKFLERPPRKKITRKETATAVEADLGYTLSPAQLNAIWAMVPPERKNSGRPRGSRRPPKPKP